MKKKQPTAGGGDERETAGETFPSPSDPEGRRKRGKKDETVDEGEGEKRETLTEGKRRCGEKEGTCARARAHVCVREDDGSEKEIRQSR